MRLNASVAKGLTGRHVLLIILGFFGVIIIVNVIFLTFALRTFPGESMKKSYLQGLNYNEVLAERAEQAALGWSAEILRTGADGVIEVRLLDADGAPLKGLTVAGQLRRIVHDRDDRALSFMSMGEGRYRAEAGALAPGAWRLAARAENPAGETFDFTARIEVPGVKIPGAESADDAAPIDAAPSNVAPGGGRR